MRKTKIICSIGPATWSKEGIIALRKAGMNLARLNFSHGDHHTHLKTVKKIRRISKEIPLILDTKGPEIRTGEVDSEDIFLEEGKKIIVTTKNVVCTQNVISVNYGKMYKTMSKGDSIFIEDGLIELRVVGKKNRNLICKIAVGGYLGSKKNVNLPNKTIDLPAVSAKDMKDILFAIKHNFDYIAASFIGSGKDVRKIRAVLDKYRSPIKIISKIEHKEAVDNIDEIIKESDAIMVARGDLGVQIDQERVPFVQKMILKKCRKARIPGIVATQMLDSMIRNPRPTRAEITDVANAILDGADCVMLSGETAKGKYPFKTVRTMGRIALKAEETLVLKEKYQERLATGSIAISKFAAIASVELGARAILIPTVGGKSVRRVAAYRSPVPIIAFTTTLTMKRQLDLVFGVQSFKIKHPRNMNSLVKLLVKKVYREGFVSAKDKVIITAAVPLGKSGPTNLLEIREVDCILRL